MSPAFGVLGLGYPPNGRAIANTTPVFDALADAALREATFALWGGSAGRPMLPIGGVDARRAASPFDGRRAARRLVERRAARVAVGGVPIACTPAAPCLAAVDSGTAFLTAPPRATAALTAALGGPDCAERARRPRSRSPPRRRRHHLRARPRREVYVRARMSTRTSRRSPTAGRRHGAPSSPASGSARRRVARPRCSVAIGASTCARHPRRRTRGRRRRRRRPPAADVRGCGPRAAYAAYAAADQAAAAFGAAGGERSSWAPCCCASARRLRPRRGRVGFARAVAAERPRAPSRAAPARRRPAHLGQVLRLYGLWGLLVEVGPTSKLDTSVDGRWGARRRRRAARLSLRSRRPTPPTRMRRRRRATTTRTRRRRR